MSFTLPNRRFVLSLGDPGFDPTGSGEEAVPIPVPDPVPVWSTHLCQPLLDRIHSGRDHVAFNFLARETSLQTLSSCLRRIPDQEITEFLLDRAVDTASVLSSEAFVGIERIREELKSLARVVRFQDPASVRARYDRNVEQLGRNVFALGRRLQRLDKAMADCPLTGSSEQIRGLYGQRVRDLSGDVRFMSNELSRWCRRFVPLAKAPSPQDEDRDLLAGRIEAVVDELGLRLREIRETLGATLYEQLRVFDPSLARKELFQQHVENVLDVSGLLGTLTSLFECIKDFDETRNPDHLDRFRDALGSFRIDEFLAFSAIRESDQILFLRSLEDLKRYDPGSTIGPGEDDPIKVFLLLTGDLIATIRREHRPAEPHGPAEPPF